MTKFLGPFLTKEVLAFSKRESNFFPRLGNEGFRKLVHGMNQLDLRFASLFELLKYMKQETLEKVPDFIVLINDFCFKVEAGELYLACQS